MPQNFKFVVLLFDCNVEKIQVKPIDTRSMRMYSLNKTDEVNFVNINQFEIYFLYENNEGFLVNRILNTKTRLMYFKSLKKAVYSLVHILEQNMGFNI
jgi:hypothetical protein